MAHIVQFRIGAAREAEPHRGDGAQIVIFPGVRRERHAEPQRRRPVKGPPERDYLELPD
jgi:hypothetical protein